TSLPVHPLPVYFAVLGLVTAAVQVRLLRRDARPGAVAAAGFLLYPLGQLAIERLRTPSENRGPVMTAGLVGMIACTVLVVRAVRWHDRRRRPHAAANAGSRSTSAAAIQAQCSTAGSVGDLAPEPRLATAEGRR